MFENIKVLSPEEILQEIETSLVTRRVGGRRVYEKQIVTYRIHPTRYSREIELKQVLENKATSKVTVDGVTYDIPDAHDTYAFYVYYVKNGVIACDLVFGDKCWRDGEPCHYLYTDALQKKRTDFLEQHLPKDICDLTLILRLDMAWITKNILNDSIGKTVQELDDKLKEYVLTKILNNGFTDKSEKARWLTLSEPCRIYMLGLDKKEIDVFPTGFSVRILLRSDKSFKEQKQFTREHGKEILRYTMNEVPHCKKIMNKIGDIQYYKPVEITVCRTNELDIKFEVKKEIVNE